VKRLLDLFRTRRAIAHEAMQRYLRGNDPLARNTTSRPGREVGIPVAYREVGRHPTSSSPTNCSVAGTGTGMPAGPQSIWGQTLENQAPEQSLQSLESVMQWMLDGGRFLVRGRIGRNAQEVEGILLRHDALEASVARSFTRCGVCGRIEANGTPNSGCARARCSGAMLPYAGPIAEGNLNARLIAESFAPTLLPGSIRLRLRRKSA